MTSQSAASPRTALVIDDEEPLRRLMARVLTRAGWETLTAGSGAEGLHLLRARPREIDLVLLDVILPDRGAGEVLPELLAERPDLRVILTSGDELPEALRARAAAVGAAFLRKPFAPATLLRALEGGGAAASAGSAAAAEGL